MSEADDSTLVSRATKGLCTDQNGMEVIRPLDRFVLVDVLGRVLAVTQSVDETPSNATQSEQGRGDQE